MPDEYLVTLAPDGWHSVETAREFWANSLSDLHLSALLEAAKVACLAYAPTLPLGAGVPQAWLLAQVMQARNILNASKTDPAQGADGELFVIRPYPLDNFVKELLRPKRGVPHVG